MSDVEQYPLCIGPSFLTEDCVLLWIVEEANIFGVRITIKRSDTHQIHVHGVNDSFYVNNKYGDKNRRLTVTKKNVQIVHSINTPPPPPQKTDPNLAVAPNDTYDDLPQQVPKRGAFDGIFDGEGHVLKELDPVVFVRCKR